MAMSRPVLAAAGCKHENNQPLALSRDTAHELIQSWSNLRNMNNGILVAGVTLYKKYSLIFTLYCVCVCVCTCVYTRACINSLIYH